MDKVFKKGFRMSYPLPYKPSAVTVFWCEKCDGELVNSEDSKTGLFFVVYGHSWSRESNQYDGHYTGVMFALCSHCCPVEAEARERLF